MSRTARQRTTPRWELFFVRMDTVVDGRSTTRGAAGTAEKRTTGLFSSGFFIHLYAECPDFYGVLTCVFALVSYIDSV
jgi:hypothetical protein